MVNKLNGLIKRLSYRIGIPVHLLISFFLVLLIFLIFDWYVSVPCRAAKIDHYILFSMTETSRFFYAKSALYNPFVFLNPNAKPVYAIISSLFLLIFPFGLLSLKVLNSILSVSTLFLLYKLVKKIGLGDFSAFIAIIFTLTFPLFFLLSIAALTEILFCFSLILAIYLLYTKKYFSSVLLVSLLPLIRQEGAMYIAIWLFFLLKTKRMYYIWILPVPTIIWILLNHLLLNHSFIYPFFVCADMPGPTPKSEIMSFVELRNFLPLIFYHPIFILFPVGLMLKMFNRVYMPITISLICHSLFLIITAITQFLIIKQVSYDFRYIVILIPLIAIMAATVFDKLTLSRKAKISITVLVSLILIGILIGKINILQRNPRITAEGLTLQQERSLKEAALWLNDFSKANGLRSIFYSGDLTTHKIIRRLKIYLSVEINMYPVRDFKEIYDPVTFKILDNEFNDPVHKGIVLILDPVRERGLISSQRISLLEQFSLVPIYFYKKQ